MAKEFEFKIIEHYGMIDEKNNSNWGICINKISWMGKEPVYDIRKFDMESFDLDNPQNIKMGKGISFYSEEGLNSLVHLLLEQGFGDTDKLKEEIEKRESIFDYSNKKLRKPFKRIS
jgi:hypothetical protein